MTATGSLVAGPVNTSTAFGGAGLADSVEGLCTALKSGDWVAAGMGGVGVALDLAATVSDPLGSLIAAGMGWLMEHLEPLKGWLDQLTGDSGAVLGFAGTWENIATAMGGAGDELDRVVRADLEAMSGASITAYAAYADKLAGQIRATGASASAIGSALKTCATVVQVVHDLVRDTLAQLIGSIISWAAEAVFTVGLATPVIIEQVTTRVSSLAARVGKSVTDVLESAKSLGRLLDALKDALRHLDTDLRSARPGTRVPSAPAVGRAPHVPEVPGAPRSALPDISDLEHLKTTDLDAWAHAVADRHPTLTADEVLAVHRYTTSPGFLEMNGASRTPGGYSAEDLTRIQGEMDNVSTGLRRMPAFEGTTYRGTNLPDAVLERWIPGNTVHDPAFTSSSTSPAIAESFRAGKGGNAYIQVEGRSGVDVQPMSMFGHEAEILFDRGVNFDVVSRTWNDGGFWNFVIKEAAS